MEYKFISNAEWIFPDIYDYSYELSELKFTSLANGKITFQLFIYDFIGNISISCSGNMYEEIPIYVNSNPELLDSLPFTPIRTAPYYIYDCLKPFDGKYNGKQLALYIEYNCNNTNINDQIIIKHNNISTIIDVNVKVLESNLPEESLDILMGLSTYKIYMYHHPSSSTEMDNLTDLYLRMLRRMHQNHIYIGGPSIIKNDKTYIFNYDRLKFNIDNSKKHGFKKFHLSGIGFRKSWQSKEILIDNLDSESIEADLFINEYLNSFKTFINDNKYDINDFSIGIADEPNIYNKITYENLARKVKSIYPELKIYDAVSDINLDDVLDIWVPRSDEYEKSKYFFDNKKENHEVWQYVCLYPRGGGYINRFMDIPLLSTRLLYWGNYLYNLSGYLHWAVNDYQDNCDPYKISCAEHHNADSVSILPPGDDKLIYPGENSPYMSIRLDNQRESAEEYEMLKYIERFDPTFSYDACHSVINSFKDVNYDLKNFFEIRNKIINRYNELCLINKNNKKVLTLLL